jgi:hypothetical protein
MRNGFPPPGGGKSKICLNYSTYTQPLHSYINISSLNSLCFRRKDFMAAIQAECRLTLSSLKLLPATTGKQNENTESLVKGNRQSSVILLGQQKKHILRDGRPSTTACPVCWPMGTNELI